MKKNKKDVILFSYDYEEIKKHICASERAEYLNYVRKELQKYYKKKVILIPNFVSPLINGYQ